MAVCRENSGRRLLRYAPLSALLPHAMPSFAPPRLIALLLALTLAGCANKPAPVYRAEAFEAETDGMRDERRRSAIFAAHIGHVQTDPQAIRPW